MLFDSLQIGVSDLEEGARQYRVLLGRDGEMRHGVHRFALERGAVELVRGEPGLRSLRFRLEPGEAPPSGGAEAYHGIAVRTDATLEPPPARLGADTPHAIDHVVVQSPDLERAIALWRDRLGVRLALDREFPQRGLRLLFFRSAGVTLEFSGALPAAAGGSAPDALWGVAYQIGDIAACRDRLIAGGASVSEIRAGQKKGTRVATVKSHTLGVPTLLVTAVD